MVVVMLLAAGRSNVTREMEGGHRLMSDRPAAPDEASETAAGRLANSSRQIKLWFFNHPANRLHLFCHLESFSFHNINHYRLDITILGYSCKCNVTAIRGPHRR